MIEWKFWIFLVHLMFLLMQPMSIVLIVTLKLQSISKRLSAANGGEVLAQHGLKIYSERFPMREDLKSSDIILVPGAHDFTHL